ncbi:metallophosphoesterase [Staphylococcus sp. NRL 18/288]|nr:metallophosphoesterase [Staphylococcus sp. NRL 18/288]MCJ1662990.1 metallophosphoesterase [Staphylococcus sp. NRL 18/288]
MKKRILAISDIHGHVDSLSQLLEGTKYNSKNDQLILVGDYVNKGPDSIGTLKLVKQLQAEGAIVLIGNHEMRWLESDEDLAMEWRHFIEALPHIKTVDNYIFAHAGIDTNKDLQHQERSIVTGHQPTELNFNLPENKVLVHGHVPNFRLGYEDDELHFENRIIGIDTGAGHDKYLTLVDLTNEIKYSIDVLDEKKEVVIKKLSGNL